jgi:hypothetical protein
MKYEHLLIFGGICIATWLLVTYMFPRLMLSAYKRAILVKGFGDGPIPVNTLYTESQALFADPIHSSASASNLATTGVNRDTLYVMGWLDLSKKPQVLHVPDMADRYYSVQFTDPSKNINFAYVGKRTTGTQAGDYLITGPGWKGAVPQRNETDFFAEQFGARGWPRICRGRQRSSNRLRSCEADTDDKWDSCRAFIVKSVYKYSHESSKRNRYALELFRLRSAWNNSTASSSNQIEGK